MQGLFTQERPKSFYCPLCTLEYLWLSNRKIKEITYVKCVRCGMFFPYIVEQNITVLITSAGCTDL